MPTPVSINLKPVSVEAIPNVPKPKSSKGKMWVLIFITIVVALGAWFVYRFRPQLPDNGGRNESKVEAMELGDVSAATAASNLPKSFPLFGQIRISYSGATSTRSSVLVTQFLSDSDVGANFYAYEKFFKADGWTIDSFRNLVDRNQYGFIESSKGGEKITLAVNIPPLAAGKYIPVNSTPGLVVFKGYSFVTITYTR